MPRLAGLMESVPVARVPVKVSVSGTGSVYNDAQSGLIQGRQAARGDDDSHRRKGDSNAARI